MPAMRQTELDGFLAPHGKLPIKVSSKSARLRFHGCTPEYIRDVCHAKCCNPSIKKGALVAVRPSEEEAIRARGVAVRDHRIVVDPGQLCPFKTEEHLCGLHGTPDKPKGCILSPFYLNGNGTLVIRNYYKLLVCYGQEPLLPAYVAFRASLDMLLGPEEAARVCTHLDSDGGDIISFVDVELYESFSVVEQVKKERIHGKKPSALATEGLALAAR